MALAVLAQQLGKRYRLGEGGYATLREKFDTRLRETPSGHADTREVWALRDVDLAIEEGDVVGIVGRNGAGKTTLLKTVARIVRPTTGVVRVRGRVGALLEVGTGFHPELTGRENVLLNGVVLGMSRSDVKRRFDDIVAFAGVERFLDTPLKRYSSGMYLRLAFAVAAHVEPDVLIVDEVLAVGDAEFQRRCLGRMSEFAQEGRTVLFVSHDSGLVGQICRRAVWMDEGRIQASGGAHEIIDQYLRSIVRRGTRAEIKRLETGPVASLVVALVDGSGEPVERVRRDEQAVFEIEFSLRERIPQFDLAIYILSESRIQVVSENMSDQQIHVDEPGDYVARLTLPGLLAPGEYVAGVWVGRRGESVLHEEVLEFTVLARPDDSAGSIGRRRLVQPSVQWNVQRLSVSRESRP